MVRVIDAHRFQRQSTYTIPENVIDSCLINDNQILLATNSTTIELRPINFNEENFSEIQTVFEPISTFQTVYEIKKLIHCKNGNFIATIEKNQNSEQTARVYSNWDCKQNSQNQNVMARIAGKVSPSNHRSDFIYMDIIELPVNGQVETISCCQLTGNIIIGTNAKQIFIYKFFFNQELNKNSYIDFIDLSYFLELSYKPKSIEISENFIMTMSDKCLNVFKIISKFDLERNHENLNDFDDFEKEFDDCFDGNNANGKNLINLSSNFEQKIDFVDFCPTIVTNLPVFIKSTKSSKTVSSN